MMWNRMQYILVNFPHNGEQIDKVQPSGKFLLLLNIAHRTWYGYFCRSLWEVSLQDAFMILIIEKKITENLCNFIYRCLWNINIPSCQGLWVWCICVKVACEVYFVFTCALKQYFPNFIIDDPGPKFWYFLISIWRPAAK